MYVSSKIEGTKKDTLCYHCHQKTNQKSVIYDDKYFCCVGCQSVYQILTENGLSNYYFLTKQAGVTRQDLIEESYDYLDDQELRKKFIKFDSPSFSRVQFVVPSIHCVSCLWLLENLRRIDPAIGTSQVHFANKTVLIDFDPQKISLSQIAHLLAELGYPPKITLSSVDNLKPSYSTASSLIVQLAVAGFCFGNIMLFSFPEYLGLVGVEKELFRPLFTWLNAALSIPVMIYSARDYFRSFWQALMRREINIDVPIGLGLLVLFFRSTYDIIQDIGPGYWDSLTGLVFFLLVGRWFQSKTYESLAFDRDYTSYFPLATRRWENESWQTVVIHDLKEGDRIQVKNQEIVPSDSVLVDQQAYIDYSFVSGESRLVNIKKGDTIYAGGRLVGVPSQLIVAKKVSQSYLTSLWNSDRSIQEKQNNHPKKLIDQLAERFTYGVLLFALLVAVGWLIYDSSRMWLVVTSVLLVACPCALALATPFTYGSLMRVFGHRGFYLKHVDIIEQLARVDTLVFDKTGTITFGKEKVTFIGRMSDKDREIASQLVQASTHPLSQLIFDFVYNKKASEPLLSDFQEYPGQGIQGTVGDVVYRIGSASFVGAEETTSSDIRVFFSIHDHIIGYFSVQTKIRLGIVKLLEQVKARKIVLLSGDNTMDRLRMQKVFPAHAQLLFNQSPKDKKQYINELQQMNHCVMMIGDGLNDAGAIKQSDVGVAVFDGHSVFTPASDAILWGKRVNEMDLYLELAKKSMRVVQQAFVLSIVYNVVSLSIAAAGFLSPLIAAVLMPLSSISVVVFVTWRVGRLGAIYFSNRSSQVSLWP